MSSTTTESDVQALEFRLGEETYCVDIEYVAEIVDGGEMTSVPQSEDYVEGVMDLRGRTTSIVNPCSILETHDVDPTELVTDGGTTQNRIVVLDSETVDADGTVGWLVSDVEEVTQFTEDDVETGPITDNDVLRGVVKRDDGFVLWIRPQELLV